MFAGAAIEFVNEVVIERVDEELQQGDPNSIACSMFLLVRIGNLCSCLFRFYDAPYSEVQLGLHLVYKLGKVFTSLIIEAVKFGDLMWKQKRKEKVQNLC